MLVCPLKTDPDWQDLVKEVGEREAYRHFIANGYEIPSPSDVYNKIAPDEEESLDTTAAKIEHLQGVFEQHGIPVEVELNGDVENAYVEGNKIVLNPRVVFNDTIPHEFGHIYVDMLGYNNEHIQRGIDQLRNTDIWNEISQLYANEGLTTEGMEKEILVTAIGREYEHQSNQPKWKVWLNKLFRLVGEKLGVERNVARDLAMDMINGDLRKDFKGSLSNLRQNQLAAKELTDLEKTNQKTRDLLATKIAIYKNTKNETALTALKKAYAQQKRLKDQAALLEFIKFADAQTKNTLGRLERMEQAMLNPTKDNAKSRLDLEKLARIADYMSAFNVINDVAGTLEGKDIDDVAFGKGVVGEEFIAKHISPIQQRIAKVNKKYKELSGDMLSEFLTGYNDNKDLTKADIKRMLTNVTEDITYTQRQLDSLAESPDQILSMFDKIISHTRAKNQKKASEFKNGELKTADNALLEYQRAAGVDVNNNEKLYDFMLKRDDAGRLTGDYKNPKLDAADPRQKYYEMFDKAYKAHQALLPRAYRRGNQLMTMLKPADEMIWENDKSIGGIYKMGKEGLKRQYQRNINDTEFVEVFTDENEQRHRFLPIHHTSKVGIKEGQIQPEQLSLDLTSNLFTFKQMADNYHEMSEVLPELEAIKRAVGERDLVLSEAGKPLINKNSESKSALRKKGYETRAYEMLVDFFNRNVYGEYKEDEGNFLGMEGVDQAKVLDSLGNYTSIVQLGLNVYSGINNMTVGQVSNWIESTGGQFYERKDFIGAHREYDKSLPSIVMDSTRRYKESKLELFAEQFDIFQEYDSRGEPIPPASRTKRFGTGALFFMNSAGEHMLQSQLMIAMSKHHRIKGKKIYSYSDYVIENNLKFDKDSRAEFDKLPQVWESIEVKDGKIVYPVPDSEMIRFTERIKGVSQRIHGNYAAKDQAAIKKRAIGRLVMKFRNWLKPGWNKRFAKETFDGQDVFDQRLGANVAGNYTIAYNFIRSLTKDVNGFSLDLMSTKWNELPEWKKQGIKRTVTELAFMGVTALIANAFAFLGDDDDEDNKLLAMIEYQALRLNSELMFYIHPGEAIKILRSPAASISLVEKTGKFLGQLIPFVGYDRYEIGDDKGELKLFNYGEKLLPVLGQIDRITNPEEQVGWLKR